MQMYCLRCILNTLRHYNDDIMSAMASQITSLTIVYSTVSSSTDERKHQGSASLVCVCGIHRWSLNSPHKGPVTRKMFPFDDVSMELNKMGNILQTTFSITFPWMKHYSLTQISLKFNLDGATDIKSAVVQVMAWHQTGNKPLSEPQWCQILMMA